MGFLAAFWAHLANAPTFYNYQTANDIRNFVIDSSRHITRWLDRPRSTSNDMVVNAVGDGSPILNYNVDGYPAVEIAGNHTDNNNLKFERARTTSNLTFVFYVKFKLSSYLALAGNGFATVYFSVIQAKFQGNFGGGGGANVNSTYADWHTVIVSSTNSSAFVMVDGVAYAIPGAASFGESQFINLFNGGSFYVRHMSSYDYSVNEDGAKLLHEKVLAEFPSVTVAPRFGTPIINAVSPPQTEGAKYLSYILDPAHALEDYAITYNAGDTFTQLDSSWLKNGVIEAALPAPYYYPNDVGLKLQSSLAKPESLLASNAGVLGYINYLQNGNFANGLAGWNSQNVTVANGVATFADNGSISQSFYGASVMRPGYQFRLLITGNGAFYVAKGEDYFGGQPNQSFNLYNSTAEFYVSIGDINHSMYLTIYGSAGCTLTKVVWTIY
jgi:hypothetical protein